MDNIVKLIKNGSQKRVSKLGKSIKEEYRRGTVEAYLSDDLAGDSEDDRKIEAAKRRVRQKQNIRRTNQRSSAATTKPPPSKPANNQFRNVQQGDTFRE